MSIISFKTNFFTDSEPFVFTISPKGSYCIKGFSFLMSNNEKVLTKYGNTYIKAKHFIKFLQLSPKSISKLARLNLIDAIKYCNRWYINIDEISKIYNNDESKQLSFCFSQKLENNK